MDSVHLALSAVGAALLEMPQVSTPCNAILMLLVAFRTVRRDLQTQGLMPIMHVKTAYLVHQEVAILPSFVGPGAIV